MSDSDEEIAFYRAIEDFFSTMRGVPHILSPKDFQLMREWWRDQIPLAAVASGITEVVAKRKNRDDDDPVVSLSYCRHAIRRHAKRLAEMRVGQTRSDLSGDNAEAPSLQGLCEQLCRVSDRWRGQSTEIAAAIEQVAEQLTRTTDLPAALLEEHLFAIEAILLDRCWKVLPEDHRATIDKVSRDAAEASGGEASTRERTYRAVRDRELRELLGLPRMELG